MFSELEQINRRPAPFSRITIEQLWADPHISEQMLRYHLDPSVEAASRGAEFIDRSVEWISRAFGLGVGARVVDLGCGPGLYANSLSRTGAAVTGVDFSPRSIAHAREAAERMGMPVTYLNADYLSWTPEHRFDLALMIYCDYGAMAPNQRRQLLARVRRMLEPSGAFLFDVSSLVGLADLEETVAYAPKLMDGFWSANAYFGFLNTFTYAEERVSVDRYEIIEAERTRTFCNWAQYFDPESLAAELASDGFVIGQLLGDVAGGAYDPSSHEFAVVARPSVG